jgi:stage V sporulation protein B
METSKNNKVASGFLKQGSILAVASILVRLIGMIYRIPMANIIGDEGNGVYSAAFEIYNILLIISSYGMPMAVSKMVSAKISQKRYKSAYKIFRCSMTVSICTGGIAALFVYFGADWIEAKFFSKYSGIAVPLRVLAPTIFIVAVMGVFRGLFQGHRTMLPTAISQIFEQVVNAFVSVGAAYFFMRAHSASPKLPAWGAAGGTLGTCIGAVTALIILLFIYMMYRPVMRKQAKRDRVTTGESLVQTYKIIFVTVVPIILSQTVYQLSGIIDVTIFNNVMGTLGYSDKVVKTLQGIYSTKYRLLVSVPIAVSTAIASSMIPNLVSSVAAGDMADARKKTDMAIKFNMIIAFPSAMGLAVLARPIITLLFPSSDINTGSMMMLIGSSCVIFYALSTVTSGVLQSIDKMGLPVIRLYHLSFILCSYMCCLDGQVLEYMHLFLAMSHIR